MKHAKALEVPSVPTSTGIVCIGQLKFSALCMHACVPVAVKSMAGIDRGLQTSCSEEANLPTGNPQIMRINSI